MDSINIEIQSSSDKAKQGVTTLIQALSSLNSKLSDVQNNATKYSKNMQKIGSTLKNIKTPQIQKDVGISRKNKNEGRNALQNSNFNQNNDNGSDKAGKNISKVNKELQKLSALSDQSTQRIKKMLGFLGKVIIANTGLKSINDSFSSMKARLSTLAKSLSKYSLALFGIRSAFYAVRNTSNEFLSSQDAVAKQLSVNISYLKYAIGSMFAPVIEYLTNLMYKLLQVIQYIVYYFARINIFAGKTAKSYANMGASAGKAAKEAQKQLQAFDELNNINLDKNNGSGGGGGGLAPGFDLSAINEDLKPLFDDIENWGKNLADKINKALNSINWDVILDKSAKIADSLAKFFNDLTFYLDWEALGYSIAQGFNTAIVFLDTFFQKYDWARLGSNFSLGLNSIVDTIQWDTLGRELTNGMRAAILFLEQFVIGFDWKKFGSNIAEMLKSAFFNIPWDSLGNAINKGITGAFDAIDTFLDTMPWGEIGNKIGKFLNDINWGEIFKRLFVTIGKIAASLTDMLWNTIFSGKETVVLGALIASFLGLSTAIKGALIVAELAPKFKILFDIIKKVGIESILSFTKTLGGIGLVLTGATLGITKFVDMWKNGVTVAKAAIAALGVALAAVGAVILGVSAPVAAIAAAVVLVVGAVALLTKAFFTNKAEIKDTKKAQEDYNKALQESKEATEDYEDAIDRATDTMERLQEAEQETGLSGEALYKQVQERTLTYAEMTKEQREVYKAYKDNVEAQAEAKDATDKMTAAKKEEIKQSFENQLAIAKESKNYDEFKQSVVDAFQKGEISADEARDLIERSMVGMSDASEQTFMEDLPNDIKEGLDPDRYSSGAEKFKERFQPIKEWFMENVVPWFTGERHRELALMAIKGMQMGYEEIKKRIQLKDWWNNNIAPWFTIQKWKELAQKGVDGIKQAFSGLNIHIKLPHFSWTSQPASGWIAKTLSALNLPTSLPKLNISWYAEGGFPDEGELFMARESGPEMVGSIGNKTAVANNDQITKAIAQAAYQAMTQALGENGNSEQPINVYIGNEKVYSGYAKYQSQASNQYGITY